MLRTWFIQRDWDQLYLQPENFLERGFSSRERALDVLSQNELTQVQGFHHRSVNVWKSEEDNVIECVVMNQRVSMDQRDRAAQYLVNKLQQQGNTRNKIEYLKKILQTNDLSVGIRNQVAGDLLELARVVKKEWIKDYLEALWMIVKSNDLNPYLHQEAMNLYHVFDQE